jgi:hypothetical protein
LHKQLVNAKRAQHAQQVLDADAAVARLYAPHDTTGDVRPVGELSLRQAAQLAPGRSAFG